MVARAKFISFLAAFVTIAMAMPVLLVEKLFHLVDEENYCEVQSSIGLSDEKR
jgi:hypothetical protein